MSVTGSNESRGAVPWTPPDGPRFPGMLLSPRAFASSRQARRLKNIPPSSSRLRRGYNEAPHGAPRASTLCRPAAHVSARHCVGPGGDWVSSTSRQTRPLTFTGREERHAIAIAPDRRTRSQVRETHRTQCIGLIRHARRPGNLVSMPHATQRAAAPAPASAVSWRFVREAARDFRTTGAVAPSSRQLASRLAEPLRQWSGLRPINVLEVGAGTGAVTRALIPLIGQGGRLDVVESNPQFAVGLQALLHLDPHLSVAGIHAVLHRTRIESLHTDERYDVIVSGLPLTNFAPAQVAAIMNQYCRLLRPHGTLTYFTYRGTSVARALTSSHRAAARHREVERVLALYHAQARTKSSTVWANVPPARVLTMVGPTGL